MPVLYYYSDSILPKIFSGKVGLNMPDASSGFCYRVTYNQYVKEHVVGMVGFEPTQPKGNRFTVCPGSPAPAHSQIDAIK